MAFEDILCYGTTVDVQRGRPDSSQKLGKAWALQVGILLNGHCPLLSVSSSWMTAFHVTPSSGLRVSY
ncbi:uncharacterized protein ARMOST_10959 [Armillaria ostoyae]|uniref:Uncharacterized protein n=1 Tax=Armillaria ostoyae TaxID=47428 RepID=A0A284RFS9_ARMOS|nr:uncharacterized protein ARMOST_10959 [Armillaria ostoyae]